MLMPEHKVVNEFQMQGKTVITLDSLQVVSEFRATKIRVDGKEYPFEFTYNDYMYVIDTLDHFLGKTVEFVS